MREVVEGLVEGMGMKIEFLEGRGKMVDRVVKIIARDAEDE